MSYDKKDLIILEELLKDSRISYSALAEKVKLTVPAVTKRIEKLKENGVIEQFTIELNYTLLTTGKPAVFLIKSLKSKVEEICAKLYKNELIKQVFQVSGTYTLVAITHFITDTQKAAVMNFIRDIEGVIDYDMLFVVDVTPVKRDLIIEDPFSIKLICDYCKREFSQDVYSKVIGGRKRYFCCNTCLTEFEKRFSQRD